MWAHKLGPLFPWSLFYLLFSSCICFVFCFNLHLVASLQSLMTGLIGFSSSLCCLHIRKKKPSWSSVRSTTSGLCGTDITKITFLFNLEAYLNHLTVEYISTITALFIFPMQRNLNTVKFWNNRALFIYLFMTFYNKLEYFKRLISYLADVASHPCKNIWFWFD